MPASIELPRDILHRQLIRVDWEDLFTGQFGVVRAREEEVLHAHVGLAELMVLSPDLKLFAIANVSQTVTKQPVIAIDLLVCVLGLIILLKPFHQVLDLLLILTRVRRNASLVELNDI